MTRFTKIGIALGCVIVATSVAWLLSRGPRTTVPASGRPAAIAAPQSPTPPPPPSASLPGARKRLLFAKSEPGESPPKLDPFRDLYPKFLTESALAENFPTDEAVVEFFFELEREGVFDHVGVQLPGATAGARRRMLQAVRAVPDSPAARKIVSAMADALASANLDLALAEIAAFDDPQLKRHAILRIEGKVKAWDATSHAAWMKYADELGRAAKE